MQEPFGIIRRVSPSQYTQSRDRAFARRYRRQDRRGPGRV